MKGGTLGYNTTTSGYSFSNHYAALVVDDASDAAPILIMMLLLLTSYELPGATENGVGVSSLSFPA